MGGKNTSGILTRARSAAKIDVVATQNIFEKVVEHVDDKVKQYPCCDAIVKGRFPSDMHGPLQCGNGLKAFVVRAIVLR
ncbi:MAG: hypothetical protein P8179_05545 [Candidatus Thiodiazotropha sp.]|jgi:transposase